jgi:hypothetical protein
VILRLLAFLIVTAGLVPVWIIVLPPRVAEAVIACTTGTPAVLNATTNTASYDFASFTPSINSTLVVIAQVRTTTAAGSMVNVSGTSLTWTQKTTGTFNAGADTQYIYWANTPGSTAASVYRVSTTGDNGAGIQAALFTCTGSDIVTSDPIRQVNLASGTSTNPVTGTLTTLLTGNGYVASWMGNLTGCPVSTAPASGGGWTEANDACFATPDSNGSAAYDSTGETGTSITFTAASSTWGLAFAEVWESGAGPAGWGALTDKARFRLVR